MRLVCTRMLLHRPHCVVIDEALDALDEAARQCIKGFSPASALGESTKKVPESGTRCLGMLRGSKRQRLRERLSRRFFSFVPTFPDTTTDRRGEWYLTRNPGKSPRLFCLTISRSRIDRSSPTSVRLFCDLRADHSPFEPYESALERNY